MNNTNQSLELIQRKEYYIKNKEHILERQKKYNKENREKIKVRINNKLKNDPEFREKRSIIMKKYFQKMRDENPDKYQAYLDKVKRRSQNYRDKIKALQNEVKALENSTKVAPEPQEVKVEPKKEPLTDEQKKARQKEYKKKYVESLKNNPDKLQNDKDKTAARARKFYEKKSLEKNL